MYLDRCDGKSRFPFSLAVLFSSLNFADNEDIICWPTNLLASVQAHLQNEEANEIKSIEFGRFFFTFPAFFFLSTPYAPLYLPFKLDRSGRR
mmetsp:Transcript_813/g.1502  ORF Transcript_813/g.1502 Transcript_813/m.1502 type:complete len:92 (+) Transcript_813:601-876(+)